MAIYTRCGAPVQIMAAERRPRWWIMYDNTGRTEVFDTEPTAKQRKGARKESTFDIWWVRAKQTGPYPDGSGTRHIGQMLEAHDDPTGMGFVLETELIADDGIREIHAECERKCEFFKALAKV